MPSWIGDGITPLVFPPSHQCFRVVYFFWKYLHSHFPGRRLPQILWMPSWIVDGITMVFPPPMYLPIARDHHRPISDCAIQLCAKQKALQISPFAKLTPYVTLKIYLMPVHVWKRINFLYCEICFIQQWPFLRNQHINLFDENVWWTNQSHLVPTRKSDWLTVRLAGLVVVDHQTH